MPPKRRHSSTRLRATSASIQNDAFGSLSELSDLGDDSEFEPGPSNSKKTSKQISRIKSNKKQKVDDQHNELDGVASSLPHNASLHVISDVKPMRSALLAWFTLARGIRGMPWRKPYDPSLGSEDRAQRAYEVWISEIMLQQTQVTTVIPYYNNWMARFPTIRALASSSIDDVNAIWKGLGYYSRASRLLSGAQKVVQSYNGKLPDNAQDLEKNIPGIGRYSAGAISSIAYGERSPVLDGNVHRLLSRVLALHAPPKAKKTLDILWSAAEVFVQIPKDEPKDQISQEKDQPVIEHPGDINQALIELGSTVCTVRNPKCKTCPLSHWCKAFQRSSDPDVTEIIDLEDICRICEPIPDVSDISLYPMKPAKTKVREESDIVNIIEWRQSEQSKHRLFLLARRPEKGLLAGLFEFLTSENVPKKLSKSSQEKLTLDLLSTIFPSVQTLGKITAREVKCQRITKIVPAGIIIHIFSHLKKSYHTQWVVIEGGMSPPTPSGYEGVNDVKWVTLTEVEKSNIGTGMLKTWKAARTLWS